MPAVLSDGTAINPGAPIGTLHLWNEHLPRYARSGPELGWACAVRRRFLHSMRLLASHAEHNPQLRQVPAFRGEAMLSSRLGLVQLERVAERVGFEAVPIPASALGILHTLGASLNVWCLTRAFNPGAATTLARVAGPVTVERLRLDETGGSPVAGGEVELRAGEIATLRPVSVKRPPDRETDLAGGAKAASALGLGRLAGRLEEAKDLSDL